MTNIGSTPFLDESHRAIFAGAHAFGTGSLSKLDEPEREFELLALSKKLVNEMGRAGILRQAVAHDSDLSLRSLVVTREAIAYSSALADSLLAVQGLGARPIALAGSTVHKSEWLEPLQKGDAIAAFALTEPQAGSDLSGIETRAVRDGAHYRLSGMKAHISNAGVADVYSVLARTGDASDSRPFSMFLVRGDATGLHARQTPLLSPHPFGEITFQDSPAEILGGEGDGLRLALSTLDMFRPSVGSAAVGMAQRALDESVSYANARRQFGKPLADFQTTQTALADSATEIEAARLLVHRAAWLKDTTGDRITSAGGMAKLFATEMAQRVIDRAVQIHGAKGVLRGSIPERLYRDIRALRIYEGSSEIQRVVIARDLLASGD